MDDETIRAFAAVVEKALTTPKGQDWLKSSHSKLTGDVGAGKFNSERALEVYTIAIERSVLGMLHGSTGYLTMKTLRESGITRAMASQLVDQFRTVAGVQDQRPARSGILAKILGK